MLRLYFLPKAIRCIQSEKCDEDITAILGRYLYNIFAHKYTINLPFTNYAFKNQ